MGSQSNWIAYFEGTWLHISGVERYPNRFSTGDLERLEEQGMGMLSYRLVFRQDSEALCPVDGVGAIHFYEDAVPAGTKKVRVYVEDSAIEFPIRKRRR